MSRLSWLTARPIAHRGFHGIDAGIVENTLPAISAAVDSGFAVEVDVRLTADNRVVVFHDARLDRLTSSTGVIRRMTLADVRSASLTGGRARIPTLEQVLDVIAGQVPLLIEMKTDWSGAGPLELVVAETVAAYDGAVAVMSFDHLAIASLRRIAPELPRGLVASRFSADRWPTWPRWRRLAYRHLLPAIIGRPHFINYEVSALPASAPLALRHFIGLPLLTWTVRTPNDRSVAAEWADQIIFEGFDPDRG